jgi:coatomer protein complex subunit gamma
MVQQYSAPGVIKSPAATMLLVRLAAKLANDDPGLRKPMLTLLDSWLRHKSELVNFEAAKAICHFPDVCTATTMSTPLCLGPSKLLRFTKCV